MPRYSEREAREAVAVSRSYSEVLRRLGMRPAGGNHALLRKYLDAVWRIPTDHFDGGERRIPSAVRIPLTDVLVRHSTYSRSNLKPRLCAVGRKYGVSDNAVRKWVKFYERERERQALESSA